MNKNQKMIFNTVLALLSIRHLMAGCGFREMPVKMVKEKNIETFMGELDDTQVSWINDEGPAETAVVKNLKTGKQHSFGTSIFNSKVILSADQKTIGIEEGSGSNLWLSFYDAESGQSVGRIDLSGERHKIVGDKVYFDGTCEGCTGKNCPCWPATVHSIESCQPVLLEKESKDYCRQIFGVSFTKKSLIDYPRTPKAKLVKQGIE